MRRLVPFAIALLVACHHRRVISGLVPPNPTDDEAWGDIGDGLVAAGNTSGALDSYLHALRLDPRDGEWQRKVAEYGGGDLLVREIDGLLPDSSTDDEAIGDRAGAFAAAGRADEACSLFRRALAIDPNDSEWSARVGECDGSPDAVGASDEGGEYGGVVGGVVDGTTGDRYGVLQLLGTTDGGSAVSYLFSNDGVADPYGGIGGLGVAPDDAPAEPAAAIPPEVYVYKTPLAAAVDEARAGHTPEARNALWSALQQDPWNDDARHLWTLLTGESQPVLLDKLVVLRPNEASLWGDLGDARLAAGKKADAIVAWQKAAALDPGQTAWGLRIEMVRATTPAPKK